MTAKRFTPNPEFDILFRRGTEREQAFEQLISGDATTIEHKSEPEALQYGAVFIEFSDDAQGDTGISISQAEWYAIEYAPDRWLVMRTPVLRRIALEVQQQRGWTRGGWEKRSVGVVVPLARLVLRS